MAETRQVLEISRPRVGRHVIVGFKGPNGIEERAATMTKVNLEDGTCTLAVLNPDGAGSQPMQNARYSEYLAAGCWTPIAIAI